jgi:hypothetical protein
MKWSVCVTTCPREQGYYLEQTLSSLFKAGFEDPIVYAEPNSVVPEWFSGQVVHRRKKYGDWSNWATGVFDLLHSEVDTDYFLLIEDDVIFCKSFKKYIEHSLSFLGDFASLSLYTPSVYHKVNFRGFHNELKDHRTLSTVAIIVKKNMLINFFSDYDVQRHRFENIFPEFEERYWCLNVDPKNSIKDAVIGKWASKKNLPIYYHTPSLAEHIGEHSNISSKNNSVEFGRKSFDFVGEDFDTSEWLNEPVLVKKYAKYLM